MHYIRLSYFSCRIPHNFSLLLFCFNVINYCGLNSSDIAKKFRNKTSHSRWWLVSILNLIFVYAEKEQFVWNKQWYQLMDLRWLQLMVRIEDLSTRSIINGESATNLNVKQFRENVFFLFIIIIFHGFFFFFFFSVLFVFIELYLGFGEAFLREGQEVDIVNDTLKPNTCLPFCYSLIKCFHIIISKKWALLYASKTLIFITNHTNSNVFVTYQPSDTHDILALAFVLTPSLFLVCTLIFCLVFVNIIP